MVVFPDPFAPKKNVTFPRGPISVVPGPKHGAFSRCNESSTLNSPSCAMALARYR